MKLSKYIDIVMKEINKLCDGVNVKFDLGVEPDMEVDNNSNNRVKFSLILAEEVLKRRKKKTK